MLRLSALLAALLVAGTASAQPSPKSPADHVYNAPSWGAAVHTLPCDAFTRVAPGVWVTNGTFVLGDGKRLTISSSVASGSSLANDEATGTFTAITLDHTPETRVLDQRCGK